MKGRALVAIGVIALVAVLVYVLARGGSGAKQAPAAPATSETTRGSAAAALAPSDARTAAHFGSGGHGAAERTAMLDAIAAARDRRRAAAPVRVPAAPGQPASDPAGTALNIVDNTGDTSAWEKRTLGTLNQLFGQCEDLGRAEDPNLAGTLVLRFRLVGEPNVGGLLERVDILDQGTSITQQTLRDCITQQLYALELDPPPDGVAVEREVSLKFP